MIGRAAGKTCLASDLSGCVGNGHARDQTAVCVSSEIFRNARSGKFGAVCESQQRSEGVGCGGSDEIKARGRSAAEQRPGFLARGVPVQFAAGGQGPAMAGVLRPRISLPDGIDILKWT